MCLFLLYYFSIVNYSSDKTIYIHNIYIFISIICLILFSLLKLYRFVISTIVIFVSYFVISNLRYTYGEDYIYSSGYNIWSALILPNLLLSFIIFSKKKMYKYWSLFFVFLLVQTAYIEKLQNHSISTDSYYFYQHIGALNYPAFYISLFCLIILFVRYIYCGKILSSLMFFVSSSVFIGLFYSENAYAFSLFFLLSSLLMLIGVLYYLSYLRYRDEELDMPNYYCFYKDLNKESCLRYSISVLYIDGYDKIYNFLGKRSILLLKKMIVKHIILFNPDVEIYKYKVNSFILVYKNSNLNDCFERSDIIKRQLAKTEFIFNKTKNIKLTVSQCVAEKKRSDLDADAVLVRADKRLQKVCEFYYNTTNIVNS